MLEANASFVEPPTVWITLPLSLAAMHSVVRSKDACSKGDQAPTYLGAGVVLKHLLSSVRDAFNHILRRYSLTRGRWLTGRWV